MVYDRVIIRKKQWPPGKYRHPSIVVRAWLRWCYTTAAIRSIGNGAPGACDITKGVLSYHYYPTSWSRAERMPVIDSSTRYQDGFYAA